LLQQEVLIQISVCSQSLFYAFVSSQLAVCRTLATNMLSISIIIQVLDRFPSKMTLWLACMGWWSKDWLYIRLLCFETRSTLA